MSLDHERDQLRALADDEAMPEALRDKLHALIDELVDAADDEVTNAWQEGRAEGLDMAPSEAEIRSELIGDIDALFCSIMPAPERFSDWRRNHSEPWVSLAEMVED